MPLFEFICMKCAHRFEALIFGAQVLSCPKCQSLELDPVISTFASAGGGRNRGSAAGCGTGGAG